MAKKTWITGDFHGELFRFHNFVEILSRLNEKPEDTNIVCLGDCGFNFFLNKSDQKRKKAANSFGFTFYCVRGNHEERPENIPTMTLVYDEEVKNRIYMESEYPNIRYLVDGEIYEFEKKQCLIIGGAYSVDKWYRLKRANLNEETNNPKITGWFSSEQLDLVERETILKKIKGKEYDMVFTHTCPISWEPKDTFLRQIDQTTVDKTMENWLKEVANNIDFKVWCFGHYHRDRAERRNAQMFYQDIFPLLDIYNNTIAREKAPGYDNQSFQLCPKCGNICFKREGADPRYYCNWCHSEFVKE